MNRYVEQGILGDAEAGRSVVVIGRRAEVRAAFDNLAATVPKDATVHRANGAERISLSGGGSIRFVGSNTGTLRGISADVVFIEGWNDLSESQRHDVVPIALRELIRA